MINKNTPQQYSYCISLGWFCGTASAMERNGLRFFSGPFDWLISDFQSVLEMMENHFAEFLCKTNLQGIDNNPKAFQDIKYGFCYPHDIKENFENEYNLIANKYTRRIERFLSAIKNPTCFFRAVRSESEIKYINENKDYIDKIIKQSNPQNIIIYLLLKNMPSLKTENFFHLNIDQYIGKSYQMATMFDRADDLLDYCSKLIDNQSIKNNLNFFYDHLTQKVKAAYLLHDTNIRENFKIFFKEKPLYIWGAGRYGVEIELILREAEIPILGFLDNSEAKIGTYINNIKVYKFEDIESINTIFIDIASSDISEAISSQIHLRDPNIEIYTWSSIWDSFPVF